MSKIHSIRREYRLGTPIKRIAEEHGVCRDTVYKYVRMKDLTPKLPKTTRKPKKMDRYAALVTQWLTDDLKESPKQRHTAHRVWQRLKDECGADISEQTVRRFVHDTKLALRGPSSQFLDLEWPPAVAQVDFGHATFKVKGIRRGMCFFVMSFPFSNVGLAQIFGGENAECVCQGLRNIFEYIGGVPTKIVFDNATGIGKKICNKVRTTHVFEACAAHYGFDYRFCNPYAGHEKGSVENKVGTQRRNLFVPVPHISDIDGYNKRLLDRCMDMAKKSHYKKGEPEEQLFVEDQFAMLSLPESPFECVEYRRAKADKKGKVRIDGKHWYSTSPHYAGLELIVALYATRIAIFDEDGVFLCEHVRAYGDVATDTSDPSSQLPLLAYKLGAWKESKVRAALPDELREHIDSLDRHDLGSAVRVLRNQCAVSGWEKTISAAEIALRATGRVDEASVAMAAARAASGRVVYEEEVDLSEYNVLMGVVSDD